MAILIYWKHDNYVKDTADGGGYNFNSNQRRLHSVTEIGDDVFVVSGVRRKSRFEIYLVAHLVIIEKAFNSPDFTYGRYRIEADPTKSKYFSLDSEPITPLLLELASIKHYGEDETYKYGQAFQTLRVLNEADAHKLKEIAAKLPVNEKI